MLYRDDLGAKSAWIKVWLVREVSGWGLVQERPTEMPHGNPTLIPYDSAPVSARSPLRGSRRTVANH